MSKIIKLDEYFHLETNQDSVVLKYLRESEEINEKTGKHFTSRNAWNYPNITLALKRYTQESLAECDDIKQILKRIDEVEELIKSKF